MGSMTYLTYGAYGDISVSARGVARLVTMLARASHIDEAGVLQEKFERYEHLLRTLSTSNLPDNTTNALHEPIRVCDDVIATLHSSLKWLLSVPNSDIPWGPVLSDCFALAIRASKSIFWEFTQRQRDTRLHNFDVHMKIIEDVLFIATA